LSTGICVVKIAFSIGAVGVAWGAVFSTVNKFAGLTVNAGQLSRP
jgi:hypothetical protein